ncbi:hypothetical protein [Pelodictyon phaeoclathratiforme]|uniref:hypothetical protein n=1 Tax=Pelodictyon phaeoclathratiforme TaxID=34090 RepID=UPI0021D7B183|nr:hypothetical protein [Pelodictyon phaeoclathratiforme]
MPRRYRQPFNKIVTGFSFPDGTLCFIQPYLAEVAKPFVRPVLDRRVMDCPFDVNGDDRTFWMSFPEFLNLHLYPPRVIQRLLVCHDNQCP